MNRITADLDNTPLIVGKKRTIAILRFLYKEYGILFDLRNVFKSPNKKGVHIILWTKHKLTNEEIIFIRMLLGDDNKRIKRDINSKEFKQHLFYTKKFLSRKERENLLLNLRRKRK